MHPPAQVLPPAIRVHHPCDTQNAGPWCRWLSIARTPSPLKISPSAPWKLKLPHGPPVTRHADGLLPPLHDTIARASRRIRTSPRPAPSIRRASPTLIDIGLDGPGAVRGPASSPRIVCLGARALTPIPPARERESASAAATARALPQANHLTHTPIRRSEEGIVLDVHHRGAPARRRPAPTSHPSICPPHPNMLPSPVIHVRAHAYYRLRISLRMRAANAGCLEDIKEGGQADLSSVFFADEGPEDV
ncbi:hypothetical protein DFH06DRAFT_1348002 [Mycena polygramma]|nr:hypothetical protein DFH06DRAFT_1348002 [Mycena polygramma]